MREETDYSLLSHNTFGIDVRCRQFLEFASVQEAREAGRLLAVGHLPYIIIGGGSNLLLTRHFPGIVVRSCIRGIQPLHRDGQSVLVSVGSGENWDALVGKCIDNGWYGAENLSLIPGDVGASAVQNIGAYGAEACELIDQVEAVRIADGAVVTIPAAECQYGYRQSRFKQEWKDRFLITHVVFRFSLTFSPRLDYGNLRAEAERRGIVSPTPRQLRQMVIDIRREKLPDPSVEGNAGSFFMNPVVSRQQFLRLQQRYPLMPHYDVDETHQKIPAAWLIEQCGWKGRTVGRAGVHHRQALVLVNRGGATGQDIVDLCNAIRADVKSAFDIDLHPEVNII